MEWCLLVWYEVKEGQQYIVNNGYHASFWNDEWMMEIPNGWKFWSVSHAVNEDETWGSLLNWLYILPIQHLFECKNILMKMY